MTSSRWLRFVLVVILIQAMPGLASFASAFQIDPDTDIDPVYAAGTNAFRNILYGVQQEHKMEVLPSVQALAQRPPNQTVIVILGKLPASTVAKLNDTLGEGLVGFVRNGGALFVASDEHSDAYWDFGVTIDGTLLRHRFGPDVFKSEFESMPLVRPVNRPNVPIPVFQGLGDLATNLPSYLELHPRSPLEILAQLPMGTVPDDPSVSLRASSPLPFAAGGILPRTQGRALFLADHSMFINCMLLQRENDNAVFANRCLEWLVRNDGTAPERDRILYLEDGVPVTDLNVALEPGYLFDMDSVDHLVHGVDGFIADQEHNDALNRLLQRLPRTTWLAIVAVGGSLVMLLLVMQRLSLRRFRPEPGMELFSVAALRYGPSRLPLRDRTAEMHRDGQFSDAARGVLNQFFTEVAPGSTKSPTVRPDGRPDQDARLNNWLRDLWQLAYGPPQFISAARFQNVLGTLRTLRRQLRGRQLHYQG
jgi:hypothetical protein